MKYFSNNFYLLFFFSDIENGTHLLLGVSAKHFSEDVSTTVSQKETTGSATLISTDTMGIIYLDRTKWVY